MLLTLWKMPRCKHLTNWRDQFAARSHTVSVGRADKARASGGKGKVTTPPLNGRRWARRNSSLSIRHVSLKVDAKRSCQNLVASTMGGGESPLFNPIIASHTAIYDGASAMQQCKNYLSLLNNWPPAAMKRVCSLCPLDWLRFISKMTKKSLVPGH